MKIISPSFEILTPVDGEAILRKIELCGRVCYKSEDKITDTSAAAFVGNIIKRGHEAVLEHHSFIFELSGGSYAKLKSLIALLRRYGFNAFIRFTTDGRYVASANIRAWRDVFKACLDKHLEIPEFVWGFIHANDVLFPEFKDIGTDVSANPDDLFKPLAIHELQDGIEKLTHIDMTVRLIVDRGVSHELVRHRLASYCQESTRYCNYSRDGFGNEITVIKPCYLEPDTETYNAWEFACKLAEGYYFFLMEAGCSPQEARAVLPNSLKTEVIMTANLREWRHFFRLRATQAAHPQMREVAVPLLKEMQRLVPVIFDDLEG